MSGTYLYEFEDEEDNLTLYDADLDELNANIFASKMLEKFIEKDYFKNSKEVEKISKFINKSVCENYNNEAIRFSKNCYLENRRILSRVMDLEDKDLISEDPKKKGKVLLTEEEIMILKSVYQFISGLDMRKYQAKMQDEVIRYEQEYNAYALGKTDEELGIIDDEDDFDIEYDDENLKQENSIGLEK